MLRCLVYCSLLLVLLGCGSSGPALVHRQTDGIVPATVTGIDAAKPLKRGENSFSGYMTYNFYDSLHFTYSSNTGYQSASYVKRYHFPQLTMGGEFLFATNDNIALGVVANTAIAQKEIYDIYLNSHKHTFFDLQLGGVFRGLYTRGIVSLGGNLDLRYGTQSYEEFSLYEYGPDEVLQIYEGYFSVASTLLFRLDFLEWFAWYNGLQFKGVASSYNLDTTYVDNYYHLWSYTGTVYSGFDFTVSDLVSMQMSYALPFGGVLKDMNTPPNHTISAGISFTWLRSKYRN